MTAEKNKEVDKSQFEKEKESKKVQREVYIKTLEDLGIETKGLSDEQILFKAVTELNKTNSRLVSAQAQNEIKSITKYTSGIEHTLKDQEFINRLYNLSVPNFYLHIFLDEDKKQSDAEIWKKINKSGINPFKSIKDMIESRNRYIY